MMREEIHDDVTNVYFTNLLSVTDGQTHLEDASRIKNDMHITAGQMKIIN